MTIATIEGVAKDFQSIRAVDGLSFEIRKGEILAAIAATINDPNTSTSTSMLRAGPTG